MRLGNSVSNKLDSRCWRMFHNVSSSDEILKLNKIGTFNLWEEVGKSFNYFERV